MTLQAFVSLVLVAGGLPTALTRMPFAGDISARLVPSLAKDSAPLQRDALLDEEASAGNAGR